MKLDKIGFYTLYDNRCMNASPTSQMKRCEMIITEYCNFSCPYCRGLDNNIYGERERKELSFREIKHNIDLWCEDEPLENIRFSGGEPTLHPDIIEIIEYAKNKGIKRIAISTNGSRSFQLYKGLYKAGVNDFSISLDACCAEDGDKLAGNKRGSWGKVVSNIQKLSELTYVTVGVVLSEANIDKTLDTVLFADSLGVSDIRLISAAQENNIIKDFLKIPNEILDKYPILKYRYNNFINGRNVRGIKETDSKKCPLVLDDSVIAGDYHFPCVIYMREQGKPIGKVSPNMRKEREEWFKTTNCHKDKICKNNCLDVCIDYNNKYFEFNGGKQMTTIQQNWKKIKERMPEGNISEIHSQANYVSKILNILQTDEIFFSWGDEDKVESSRYEKEITAAIKKIREDNDFWRDRL